MPRPEGIGCLYKGVTYAPMSSLGHLLLTVISWGYSCRDLFMLHYMPQYLYLACRQLRTDACGPDLKMDVIERHPTYEAADTEVRDLNQLDPDGIYAVVVYPEKPSLIKQSIM
jgi:hypothetical protein